VITAGVDAGSRSIKVVLFDHDRSVVLASGIRDQGVDQPRLAEETYHGVLREAALSTGAVSGVVATGYGRSRVGFAQTTITEITCHARGVFHLMPETRTVIEIGGQDSKVILLEAGGRVRDFSMNDRCAAGTGRFLEVVAVRLGVDLPELGRLGRSSRQPALLSSTCVVFAETEIVGALADGVHVEDLAAGVQQAIATRVAMMAGRAPARPICFTGGVALLAGMVKAVEEALSGPVTVAPQPQFTGALGAAILAREQAGR
jgi:(R)-2-hydroxyacyl-CoA dehydratese activating ATPase